MQQLQLFHLLNSLLQIQQLAYQVELALHTQAVAGVVQVQVDILLVGHIFQT
jgi:hypothetical protein